LMSSSRNRIDNLSLVMGIETSCDETSVAIVKDGTEVLSNVVHSQIDIHRAWGGVVPELASRHHAEQIDLITRLALEQAEVKMADIQAVAATYGPGLIGALLIGLSAGKAIAMSRDLPFIGVDHIEAHAFSVELSNGEMQYPALSLVISGGHTSLFYQERRHHFELIARTRDDAAGEAYDKVAKLLSLGYPGGPIIDRLAPFGNRKSFPLSPVKIKDGSLDFSFSGLKTAVLNYSRNNQQLLERDVPFEQDQQLLDLLAAFQHAVIREVKKRFERVLDEREVRSIGISGGVSMNRGLREDMAVFSERKGIPVLFPEGKYTGDNAAMIAALGHHKLKLDGPSPMTLGPVPNLKLAEKQGAKRHPRSG
jgi:N6-L-threonylcarbamoyladenine synthase